jgi:hypothetical protein
MQAEAAESLADVVFSGSDADDAHGPADVLADGGETTTPMDASDGREDVNPDAV